MSVSLIIGHTGVGKTNRFYNEIIEESLKTKLNSSVLLIVPEQATLENQHALIRRHKNHSISNIEILSFLRLAHRLTDVLGVAGKTILSDIGKSIIIRKIIEDNKEDYPFLNRHIHKKGYVKELKRLMLEFSSYDIQGEDFMKMEDLPETSLLKMKLKDCHRLYNAYKKKINDVYISGDTLMESVVLNCHKSQWLKETNIYIDGFYGFTPIQYKVIEQLMQIAKSVKISITVAPEIIHREKLEESHLFYEGYKVYKRIKKCAIEVGCYLEKDIVLVNHNISAKSFLVHNLYQYPYNIYKEEAKNINIHLIFSKKKEVELVRSQIMGLIQEDGYKYRDISILVGNVSHYEKLFHIVFDKVNIPYYIDKKKSVLENDAISFMLNCVKIISQRMTYESMFSYLKSEYIDIDKDLLDHLENYVVRYGIRGMKRWDEVWSYVAPDIALDITNPGMKAHLEKLNVLREYIVEPIKAYKEDKSSTIKEHVSSLYKLLIYHNIEEKISKKADALMDSEDYNQGNIYKQLYLVMMNLLDQLCEVNFDEKVTYKEFYQLLEAGFETVELGSVPARMDEIIIGDLTRTKLGKRKIIFIMGVNEGVIPSLSEGTGLLTGNEREEMREKGFYVAPSSKQSLFREQFYTYMGLLKAEERLYLSYTQTDEKGKAMRPSHLIHMVKKILPKHTFVNETQKDKNTYILYHPEIAYEIVMDALQRGGISKYNNLYSWMRETKPYKNRINKALQSKRHHTRIDKLSAPASENIYGETLSNSVSRLEKFSQCPFAHFIAYGLRSKEREVYEITMPQLGLIFHRVIELFSERIKERELEWRDINDDIRRSWIDELVDDTLKLTRYSIFFDGARNKAYIERIKKMCNKSIWAIGYQICQGEFKQIASELSFSGKEDNVEELVVSLNKNRKMYLQGIIDRVDLYESSENSYMIVIDYKTSNMDFSLTDTYHGLQLQLLVYLNSAIAITEKEREKSVKPAGIFYFKIDDPYIRLEEVKSSSIIQEKLLSEYRLKGMVIDNEDIVKKIDREFIGKSIVIPIKKNKDGSFAKSSKVLENEEFKVLRTFVYNKIKDIGNQIISGTVSPKPFKQKDKEACDYCNYKSICGFDNYLPTDGYRYLTKQDDEKIINNMRENNKIGI